MDNGQWTMSSRLSPTQADQASPGLRQAWGVLIVAGILLILLSFCSCRRTPPRPAVYDLEQIQDSGVLSVLTLSSSTSYFNYRGQEMGFQYELALQLAEHLGVDLKVIVARSVPDLVARLRAGEGDLIAYNLPITKERRDSLYFCGREFISHQVIVQRQSYRVKPLSDVTELVGREVYVKPGKHYLRLKHLNEELGGGIIIHLVAGDSITHEDLITQVARGEIDLTVADDDVARLNATYYPNLNVELAISFDQRASWAVLPERTHLAMAVNAWGDSCTSSPTWTATTKRYFEISKAIPHSPILSLREGKISHYDHLFKRYAPEIGWDWRLLASLAYTESNFDTTVVSWAGAKGLMQLMPATARAMGVPEGMDQNPEQSIRAAVKYIASTMRSLTAVPQERRLPFVLASYNAGLGHVLDAMALAEKYGKDKTTWEDNVETFILLKSQEKYYTDSVCRNGYFRGVETYAFVREVTQRWEQYKKKIP